MVLFLYVMLLKKILYLFLKTNLYTACCAVALCMATEYLIKRDLPFLFNSLHLFLFGSSILVYNTPNFYRLNSESRRFKFLFHYDYKYFRILFVLLGILFIIISLYDLPIEIVFLSIFLAFFAFAYFLPFLPFNAKKRLRDYGWLKILILSIVWTIATSVLPIIYLHAKINNYIFEIFGRFLLIFVLCIIYDIRDIDIDCKTNIKTLPNLIGLKRSYFLIYFSLIAFLCASILQYNRFHIIERFFSALITIIIIRLVTLFLKKYPSEIAYLLLADGVMLIYSIVVFVI